MKDGPCPKCGGEEILVLDEVTDQIGTRSIGLAQDAYVCAACGLIEFYARDVGALRGIARLHRPGGAGPFR